MEMMEMAKRIETVLNKYSDRDIDIATHRDGFEMMNDFQWALGIEMAWTMRKIEKEEK